MDRSDSKLAAPATLIVTVASLAGLVALLFAGRNVEPNRVEFVPPKPPPSVSAPQLPLPPPIDWQAVRRDAWTKIAPRLDAANRESKAEIDRQLAPIAQFFDERKSGSPEFARKILS